MRSYTLLLTLLAVVAAGISGALYWAIGDEKGDLENQVVQLQREIASHKQRALDLAAERDAGAARLAAIERDVHDTKARNTSLEARNAQLAREVTQLRDTTGSRERSDRSLQQEADELRRQLAEAKAAANATIGGATPQEVSALESRIGSLAEQLHALQLQDPETAAAMARAPRDLQGTVIEVGPKTSFVVLNIGARDGAAPALEMAVKRGAMVLARVRLTDVRESYSVAHVLTRTGSATIRTGDTATRL